MANYNQSALDIITIVQKLTAAGANQSTIHRFLNDIEYYNQSGEHVDVSYLDIYISEALAQQKTLKHISLNTYLDDQYMHAHPDKQ